MQINPSRARFIRGDIFSRHQPVRPPWALPELEFLSHCTSCSDCIDACDEDIIIKSSAGYPAIDFSQGECTFCGDCVEKCPTGALLRQDNQPAWNLKAVINDRCVEFQGVVCGSCSEQCEVDAISYYPTNRIRNVVVDETSCSGCGACFVVCPVGAIEMKDLLAEDIT